MLWPSGCLRDPGLARLAQEWAVGRLGDEGADRRPRASTRCIRMVQRGPDNPWRLGVESVCAGAGTHVECLKCAHAYVCAHVWELCTRASRVQAYVVKMHAGCGVRVSDMLRLTVLGCPLGLLTGLEP